MHKAKPYRPKSTESDTFEGEVYWIVEGLHRMQSNEYIPVGRFHRLWSQQSVRQIVSSSPAPPEGCSPTYRS